jgi:gluconolactonase
MRTNQIIGFGVGVILSAFVGASAMADEVTVVTNVLGPEGPVWTEGNLYYVGFTASALYKWDGKTNTVLNSAVGCGHNGLVLTKQKTLLVACDDVHGAILELDLSGKELRRWETDSAGQKLDGGINDLVITANGGMYATLSGPFIDPPVEVVGKILYRAPGSDRWMVVATDLNYANGIGVSPDQKTLYVSETVGNCILKYTINPDGTLSHRSNFALLNVLLKNKVDGWWTGPDSMKIDRQGNLYVAQLFCGRVLKISPAGKLLHVFDIAAGNGPTNVAFDEGEKHLYVTVIKDVSDPQCKGSIVKIPNVE